MLQKQLHQWRTEVNAETCPRDKDDDTTPAIGSIPTAENGVALLGKIANNQAYWKSSI
jgi:hypothetical protein